MLEMIKMAICDLEDVIASAGMSKEELDWIYPIDRDAFEVY